MTMKDLKAISDPVAQLNIEPLNVQGKRRGYPTVREYYQASDRGGKFTDKPLTYQPGLSNYSNVVLGDDRITFTKSLSQMQYKDHDIYGTSARETSFGDSKTPHMRRREYQEALETVGSRNLDTIEHTMKIKLHQRKVADCIQLRKTFRYFDRDNSGRIAFQHFNNALELMGFQFSETQALALFGRYDDELCGTIDYNAFVDCKLEVPATEIHPLEGKQDHLSYRDPVDAMVEAERSEGLSTSVLASEREAWRRSEVRRVFSLVQRTRGNSPDGLSVSVEDAPLLCLALGLGMSEDEALSMGRSVSTDGRSVSLDAFYQWWASA